jgi:hypothetical protein
MALLERKSSVDPTLVAQSSTGDQGEVVLPTESDEWLSPRGNATSTPKTAAETQENAEK